jgi:hypothetical protein
LAIIRAIRKDSPEIAIPGPAIWFSRFSALGPLIFKSAGTFGMMKEMAEARVHTLELASAEAI